MVLDLWMNIILDKGIDSLLASNTLTLEDAHSPSISLQILFFIRITFSRSHIGLLYLGAVKMTRFGAYYKVYKS